MLVAVVNFAIVVTINCTFVIIAAAEKSVYDIFTHPFANHDFIVHNYGTSYNS